MDNKFLEKPRIRLIREVLNVSQTTFAAELDIPRTTLINYEKGISLPSDLLLKLKEKWGINIDWLLTGEGEMFLPGRDPREKAGPEGKCFTGETYASKIPAGILEVSESPAGIEKYSDQLEVSPPPGGPPPAPEGAAVPGKYAEPPPRKIRKISLELQGIADEIDVGGPVPARLRPLVRRVARLDDDDLTKATAYVDDLLQKVKYAHGQEESDETPGAAGIA